MGHVEPATTLKNYIHICDFLQQDEIGQSSKLASLTVDQLANISGIPIPTLYRYKKGTEPGKVAANVLYSASKSSHIKVPDNKGGAYRHRIVASHLELDEYDHEGREIWSQINEPKIFTRKSKHSDIRPLIPLEQRPATWKKTASKSTNPGMFPYEPHLVVEKDFLHQIMTAFETLDQQARNIVIDFVDDYCENFIINSGGLWHEDYAWAKKQIDIIRLLKIPLKLVQLKDLRADDESLEEAENRRELWEKKIGFSGAKWKVAEKRKNKKRIKPSIIINVLSKSNSISSYAFRYAMYLIRIGYWNDSQAGRGF